MEDSIDELVHFIHDILDQPYIRSQINIADLAWAVATPLWDAGYRATDPITGMRVRQDSL